MQQIPLSIIQEQAQQDAKKVENIFTGKAPYITLIGVLTTASLFAAYKNKRLRSEISSLQRSLEWEKKSNQIHYTEAQRSKAAYQKIQDDYKTLERKYNWLLEDSRKEAATARVELTQARSETKALEKAFAEQIAELQQRLRVANYLINQDEHLIIVQREMERFNPLFDSNLPKVQREALLKEFKGSVWFTSMPQETRERFASLFQSLSFHYKDRSGYFLSSTKEAFDVFMSYQTTSAGERMMALIRNLLNKKNILLSGIIFFTAISASAANEHQEAQKEANRIYQNVDLLINATPEELTHLGSNPITYKACLQSAAALHEFTKMDKAVLQEMQRADTDPMHTFQLRSVRAH